MKWKQLQLIMDSMQFHGRNVNRILQNWYSEVNDEKASWQFSLQPIKSFEGFRFGWPLAFYQDLWSISFLWN